MDNVIHTKQAEREDIKNQARRMCGLAPSGNEIDILGKVRRQTKLGQVRVKLNWVRSWSGSS